MYLYWFRKESIKYVSENIDDRYRRISILSMEKRYLNREKVTINCLKKILGLDRYKYIMYGEKFVIKVRQTDKYNSYVGEV